MGLLKRYNKEISQTDGNTGIIRDPNLPLQAPDNINFGKDNFSNSNLDLENPTPLGGPINVSFTTKVGEDVVTSPTTQPYTPKNTYTDSFTDPLLIARTIDPFK